MSRRILVSLLATLMLALCLPAIAGATPVTYQFTGRNADAYSFAGEVEGGPYEFVSLWGGNTTSMQTGLERPERFREKFGMFWREAYTPATDSQPEAYRMLMLSGPAALTFDRALTSAKLDMVAEGTVAVWYGEMPWEGTEEEMVAPDEESTVTVSAVGSWTGSGPLWRESYHSKTSTDGFFSIDRNSSTRRDATCEALIVDSAGNVWFQGGFDTASIYDSKGVGHMKGEWPDAP